MSAVPQDKFLAETVATRLFGPLTVSPDETVVFPRGLPGFDQSRRFVLLPASQGGLYWLQCLDTPELAFMLVETVRVSENAWAQTPGALAIVTLPSGDQPATANLRAPVLIDLVAGLGRQAIMADSDYGTAHPFDLSSLLGDSAK
ncbi:MAG: flagellar assembly protein FliW [Gemmatimonadales bacterium]